MSKKGLLHTNAQYRNLWLAQTGSQFGNWFNQVALAQTTLILTGSAAVMGTVLLCRGLPSVLFGPFMSPLVDRYNKRLIMLLTDCMRAIFAISFIFAFTFHLVWMLYIGSLLLGFSGVLFSPARKSLIPFVVNHADLASANAIEGSTSGLLSVFGAICGGVVSTLVSPTVCFLINSLSYVWSAWWILATKWNLHQHELTHNQAKTTSYFEQLREGLTAAWRNQGARQILLIGISWGLAGGGYSVMIPLLGYQVYHMGGNGIGLLYAIDGCGVFAGSYLVSRYVRSSLARSHIWYGVAYLLQALCFTLLGQFSSFLYGALFLFSMRVASGVIIPLDTFLLQLNTQNQTRGRVFALHESTYGGVMQLSYIISGFAFSHFGTATVSVYIGIVSFLCGCSWLLYTRTIPLSIPHEQAM